MPRRKEVDQWMGRYDNPMKAVVQRVREILLAADKRIDECIKWQSPTFTYEGNLASFNPRSKKHASLMFHTGRSIPGKHPRMDGGGGTASFMKFESVKDADAAKGDLKAVVKAWISSRSSGGEATKRVGKGTTKKQAGGKSTKKARKAAKKSAAKRKGAKGKAAKRRKTTARKSVSRKKKR